MGGLEVLLIGDEDVLYYSLLSGIFCTLGTLLAEAEAGVDRVPLWFKHEWKMANDGPGCWISIKNLAQRQ